jgi:hypothetical protein
MDTARIETWKINSLLLVIFLSSPVLSEASNGFSYSVSAEIYRNDSAVLNSISAQNVRPGFFPLDDTDYKVKLLSENRTLLFEDNLQISFETKASFEKEDGTPFEESYFSNSTEIELRIPGFVKAKYLQITHKDKLILESDLSASICNRNGLCELGETIANCREDCSPKEKNNSLQDFASRNINLLIMIALILAAISYAIYRKLNVR